MGGLMIRIISKIPILSALTQYRPLVHRKAIIKAIVLWVLSTSPVILAILFSKFGSSEDETLLNAMGREFHNILQKDGIFVYAASFLSPFLFIVVGRFIDAYVEKDKEGKLVIKEMFRGYWLCFVICALLLLVTGLSYTSRILSPSEYQDLILGVMTRDTLIGFYVVSLYFWYLALLDEYNLDSGYVQTMRRAERKAVDAFEDRINPA